MAVAGSMVISRVGLPRTHTMSETYLREILTELKAIRRMMEEEREIEERRLDMQVKVAEEACFGKHRKDPPEMSPTQIGYDSPDE